MQDERLRSEHCEGGNAIAVRSESRAEIAERTENVWGYVTDVSRWPEWAAAIRECRVSGGAPLRAGVQLEQRAKGMFGSTRDRTLDVTAIDDARRLEFAGTMGPSALRWGFDLIPVDANQTGVVLWVEIEPKGPMRAIPGGVLKGMIRRVNNVS